MRGVTIRKAQSGRWQAIVRYLGVSTSTTRRLKRDAERWAKQEVRKIEEGRLTADMHGKTLGGAIEMYRTEKGDAAGATQRQVLGWWSRKLGNVSLSDLTTAMIREARESLRRSGKAPATCNRYVGYLSGVVTVAREAGMIVDHPVRALRRLKEPRGRVRFLTKDEQSRLVAACEDSGGLRLRTLVVLALYTGMRRGELLQLRWDDVDLEGGVVLVRHRTKTDRERSVPLMGTGLEAMRKWRRERRFASESALVFAARPSSTVASFQKKRWYRALAASGVEDFRFHDLRHSAASHWAQNGVLLNVIQVALGHTNPAQTARYSHLTVDSLRASLGRAPDRMGGEG